MLKQSLIMVGRLSIMPVIIREILTLSSYCLSLKQMLMQRPTMDQHLSIWHLAMRIPHVRLLTYWLKSKRMSMQRTMMVGRLSNMHTLTLWTYYFTTTPRMLIAMISLDMYVFQEAGLLVELLLQCCLITVVFLISHLRRSISLIAVGQKTKKVEIFCGEARIVATTVVNKLWLSKVMFSQSSPNL